MKTITFTYTKSTGTVSKRVLAVMKSPCNMFEGIDVSDISEVEQGVFLDKLESLNIRYLRAIEGIKSEFDLTHSYRRFDPSKMTDIKEE